jgi:ABC-type transport system involved in multi-copper enzyme maturation permease subunit
MRNYILILKYTFVDFIKNKSYLLLLAFGIVFIILTRGCYNVNYFVNGKILDSLSVIKHASNFSFHIICTISFVLSALFSMNIFSKDKKDGTMVYILSKPISRTIYILGRITGIWFISFLFMFVLHFTIFAITGYYSNNLNFEILLASLLCSLNLLFIILFVSMLSFFIPDFACAIIGLFVYVLSFISDSIFLLMQNTFLRMALENNLNQISLWRIFFPKLMCLQYYSASIINKESILFMANINPIINLIVYIFLLIILLALIMRKQEI